jgi:allophanate hydrolase subunit 1
VLPYGAGALLVELPDAAAVGELTRALRAGGLPADVELVPAARTVLVRTGDPRRGAPPGALARLGDHVRAVAAGLVVGAAAPPATGNAAGHDHLDDTDGVDAGPVTVAARYDGEDLADVADRVGLQIPELIELHSSTVFTAAFCGFTAGFCYLTGLPASLVLPRRPSPRPRVPANTLAIADVYCGVYPSATPGGWNLLGTTLPAVWDARRDPPNLMSPGQRVRFVPHVDR